MEKRKSVEYATLAEDRSISTVVQEQQEQQRLVASETRQGIMALFVVEVSSLSGIQDRVRHFHALSPRFLPSYDMCLSNGRNGGASRACAKFRGEFSLHGHTRPGWVGWWVAGSRLFCRM